MLFIACGKLLSLIDQRMIILERLRMIGICVQIEDGLLNGKINGSQHFQLGFALLGRKILIHVLCSRIRRDGGS